MSTFWCLACGLNEDRDVFPSFYFTARVVLILFMWEETEFECIAWRQAMRNEGDRRVEGGDLFGFFWFLKWWLNVHNMWIRIWDNCDSQSFTDTLMLTCCVCSTYPWNLLLPFQSLHHHWEYQRAVKGYIMTLSHIQSGSGGSDQNYMGGAY